MYVKKGVSYYVIFNKYWLFVQMYVKNGQTQIVCVDVYVKNGQTQIVCVNVCKEWINYYIIFN